MKSLSSKQIQSRLQAKRIDSSHMIAIMKWVTDGIIKWTDVRSALDMSDVEYNLWSDLYAQSSQFIPSQPKEKFIPPSADLDLWNTDSCLFAIAKRAGVILNFTLPWSDIIQYTGFTENDIKILKMMELFEWKVVPGRLLFAITQADSEVIADPKILKTFISLLNDKFTDWLKIKSVWWRWYVLTQDNEIVWSEKTTELLWWIISDWEKILADKNESKKIVTKSKRIRKKNSIDEILKNPGAYHAKKLKIMRAIHDWEITKSKVMARMNISEDEYAAWDKLYTDSIPKLESFQPIPVLEIDA